MQLADLGLIGNCQVAAHVTHGGSIEWACMPRFDTPPVFGGLLDPDGGRFSIVPADRRTGTQRYLSNTNILETRFQCADGAFRVLDFAPRFIQHDRSFRPTKFVRIVEPLSGTPRIRVMCDPVLGWSKKRPEREVGSHHIAYAGFESPLRLTTDAPLTYLNDEPWALTERRHFVLSWGQPVEEPLVPLCDRFLRETARYWQTWVKHCAIPAVFQEEVIRSALALKLHCFEDTGAIVAALTTSIPESPGSGRTWDYRYCWLRDTFYTLGALRLLGHFEEREQFLHYLLNVAASSPNLELAPLYGIDGKPCPPEVTIDNWAGFNGERPVRVGNDAATHLQHDVFGEMVLALAPIFLDARFREAATPPVLDLVERLARRAIEVAGKPDAGIWEFRARWRPQTFSTVMCWAAADRAARIARRFRPERADELAAAANRIRAMILREAIDPARNCLTADHGGTEVDAALLQAVTLNFLPPDDPRMIATVDCVRTDLDHQGWLRRYRNADDFGVPSVAFTICTFWLVDALARIGKVEDARAVMERVRAIPTPLGLLSEDVDPGNGVMWGNYPQAYSHVGLIHGAFAVAPRWSEVG